MHFNGLCRAFGRGVPSHAFRKCRFAGLSEDWPPQAELVLSAKFGMMAALKGNDIVSVPLATAVSATRLLDMRYYEEAKEFFR